jgi:ligand-binding sensor domain-containing protein/signal transduction histidine kinase
MWLNHTLLELVVLRPGRLILTGLWPALFLFPSFKLQSADFFSEYSRHLWQAEEGLPHSAVQAIAQTDDGFLWVGTREGLARFDGLRFSIFNFSTNAPQPSVTCLCAGRDNALWIGTEREGLFSLRGGELVHYDSGGSQGAEMVSQIKLAADGTVWIAYRDGLASWQDGKFQYPLDPALNTHLVLSVCLDQDGGVWTGAGRGVQRWKDGKVSNYKIENGFAIRAIRALYSVTNGDLWMGGSSGVIQKKVDGTFFHYRKGNGPSGIITALLQDQSGNFWVGTQGGLSRFANGIFSDDQEPGGASYAIYAIFEDRDENIWVGSEEGLTRLTLKPFINYTRQTGLTQNATTSVCAGRDGSVWVGTWGGGLDCLKNGTISVYSKTNGLSSDFVVATHEIADGSLWVGTAYAPGFNQIRNGAVIKDSQLTEQIGSVATVIVETDPGDIWIGSHAGLFQFFNNQLLTNSDLNSLSNHIINALCKSRDGSLWIGTDAGLRRWRNGHLETPALEGLDPKNSVIALYEDAQGTLWLGFLGSGLGRVGGGRFTNYSTRQGLAGDSIYAIIEDSRGNLWFSSSKGIFRAERKQFDDMSSGAISSLNCIVYGKADGVLGNGQSQDVTQPAVCQSTDGKLWFRTTQGVVATDPAKIKSNEEPPPVSIEEILADRKSVFNPLAIHRAQSRPGEAAVSNFPGGTALALDVAPGRGELEIHYTALNMRGPEKDRFKYKLEGADADWVDAGGRRTAYYNHLAPGTYLFRVLAGNDHGIWNNTGASVRLILRPHFWETWWFIGTCGLLAAGSIGGGSRYVTRKRLQRRMQKLEHQNAIEKERARIARDMHDELGAKLTRISFQGATALRSMEDRTEAEKQVGSMAQTARDLVASLDEIVWAVDPGNDSLENLANYICRYASELFANGPMTCDLSIPDKLPDCRLPTDVRHNVFLAFKEALNNALKHSGGTQVLVSLHAKENEFELVIADNGCGLALSPPDESSVDRIRRTGHGLANLRARLAAINGRCELESSAGHGTRVKLTVPLAQPN